MSTTSKYARRQGCGDGHQSGGEKYGGGNMTVGLIEKVSSENFPLFERLKTHKHPTCLRKLSRLSDSRSSVRLGSSTKRKARRWIENQENQPTLRSFGPYTSIRVIFYVRSVVRSFFAVSAVWPQFQLGFPNDSGTELFSNVVDKCSNTLGDSQSGALLLPSKGQSACLPPSYH